MASVHGSSWPAVLRTTSLKHQVHAKSRLPLCCCHSVQHLPSSHSFDFSQISSTKVLCIGAGGIGCELLKTLVCTGFQHIEVVSRACMKQAEMRGMLTLLPQSACPRLPRHSGLSIPVHMHLSLIHSRSTCHAHTYVRPLHTSSAVTKPPGRPGHHRDQQPQPAVPVPQAPCRPQQGAHRGRRRAHFPAGSHHHSSPCQRQGTCATWGSAIMSPACLSPSCTHLPHKYIGRRLWPADVLLTRLYFRPNLWLFIPL